MMAALKHVRRQPVAYLALFFSLSGSAFAANVAWTGDNIKDGTLTGDDIAVRSVPLDRLQGDVGSSKGTVSSGRRAMAPGAIFDEELLLRVPGLGDLTVSCAGGGDYFLTNTSDSEIRGSVFGDPVQGGDAMSLAPGQKRWLVESPQWHGSWTYLFHNDSGIASVIVSRHIEPDGTCRFAAQALTD